MTNNQSTNHLQKDPVMARLIAEIKLTEWAEPDLSPQAIFADILETILTQQLSNKAAETIVGRFKKIFGDKFPSPKKLLATPDEKIRACGTSWTKAKYLKNVAQAVIDKSLDLSKLPSQTDDQVYEELLKIKGIGKWSAEMILMFTLRREDVFSPGDIGLQNAITKLYKIKRSDTKKIIKLAEKWRPYRTLACRYLWRSVDGGGL